MKFTTALVGPRGWAALVLAGGATLAAPFLRSPHVPNATKFATDATPPDFSPDSWPDLYEQQLAPTAGQATDLSASDWRELSTLQTVSVQPPKVTGKLPSTRRDPLASVLPSWADRGQRIDHVVDAAARGEPLEPNPPKVETEIQPLRPWVNASKSGDETVINATSSLANSLPTNTPDPFSGWSSVAQTAGQNAPHFASQPSIKPFEERPKQWPDQKLRIGELPMATRPGISAIVQDNRTKAPAQDAWGTISQDVAQAPIGTAESITSPFGTGAPRVGLSSALTSAALPAVPENAPSMSAPPMLSSPADAPYDRNPASEQIPVGQPVPMRTRQFIFQPSKRA